MADNQGDPGTDMDGDDANGYQTQTPIVTWDPVLGASAYEVEVSLFNGAACSTPRRSRDGRNQRVDAAGSAGTPTRSHGRITAAASRQAAGLVPGTFYCVRVRAFTDKAFDQNHVLHDVVGDWSYLDLGCRFADADGSGLVPVLRLPR